MPVTKLYTKSWQDSEGTLRYYKDEDARNSIDAIEGKIPAGASSSNKLATASDLATKVDAVSGKGLSTEDYTTAEKTKLSGLENYDDTALAGRVTATENAITTLNGTGTGSVQKTVDDAIAEVIADAPESFDTLKEISDWIADHPEDTAQMNADIQDLKAAVGDSTSGLVKDVADLSSDVSALESGKVDKNGTDRLMMAAEGTKLAGLVNYDDTALSGRVTNVEAVIPNDATSVNKLATAADVATKVDAVAGKQLSTEDYTSAEKTKLASLNNYDDTALAGRVSDIEDLVPTGASSSNQLATASDVAAKVDAVSGKGLSTEDYTTAEKTKLGGVETGAEVNIIEEVQVNGVALTPDSNRAVNVTIPSTFDASAITTGTIDIARLPSGALERLVTVANQAARYQLTSDDVQLGDVVKEQDTGLMYYVVNLLALDSPLGYEVFTAGAATSVPWSGVTNKPDSYTPAAHTHTQADITGTIDADTVDGHTVGTNVPSDAVFTDTVYTPPTYTAKTLGLYKVATDSNGYVSNATAVAKSDITGLGIPGSVSSVINVTLSASGWTAQKTYTVSNAAITATANGYIGLAPSATAAQREASRAAMINVTSQSAGSIVLTCDADEKPTVNLPIVITLLTE